MKKHYNEKYFNWQIEHGQFGAIADKFKFEQHVNPNDRLIEFGCGGGFLINVLNCKQKIGIEINQSARENAKSLGIIAYESISSVNNDWADIIISNHALEHTLNPLKILESLYKKLRIGGKIIFVVPNECGGKFEKNDINQHLYTWTPQTLGNLFQIAGFKICSSRILKHRWPPYHKFIYSYFGSTTFHFLSKIYSIMKKGNSQVIVVAEK